MRIISSIKPYVIVFSASACGLVLEIVAGRILAPTIGVSLYTWTSIIGVVLAGISAGSYLGGRIADRFPSSTTLGFILLAGGISSLSVLPLVDLVSEAYSSLPIILRIVLVTSTLFFIPSVILGMVTPVIVKLRLQDLAHTGNVVGRIYAISTAGAIFGVFITGFVLIQWIGTRYIVLAVSLVLVLMALAFGRFSKHKIMGFVLIAIFAGIGSFSFITGTLQTYCDRESNYFCIMVVDENVDGHLVRTLVLDKLVHSYVDLDDPKFLAYGYEKVLADVATYVEQQDHKLRALVIGGGGYTMPRFLETQYPLSTVDVIEIDSEVTDVAFEYMGLPRDTKIITYNQDARMVIPKLQDSQYDLIIGDAFNDFSVPYHLTTLEFNADVVRLLDHNGIYVVSIIDKMYSGRFLKAYVNTLQQTFPYVYVMAEHALWNDVPNTFVVAGSLAPISLSGLENANSNTGRAPLVTKIMPEDSFRSWINTDANILLTDDYVPVDNLLAPLYRELQ